MISESPMTIFSSPRAPGILDSMDEVLFCELLNFRFGFYQFSKFLESKNALHVCLHSLICVLFACCLHLLIKNLSFVVEVWQYKREMHTKHNSNIIRSSKKSRILGHHRFENGWLKNIDFDYLPMGDCLYRNSSNLVFHAWSIYIKYIQNVCSHKNNISEQNISSFMKQNININNISFIFLSITVCIINIYNFRLLLHTLLVFMNSGGSCT